MSKEIKNTINVILAAIPLAMGVAIIVLTSTGADVTIKDLIRMLAFGVVSLGIFALNSIKKDGKE